jgi:hypothetical protein
VDDLPHFNLVQTLYKKEYYKPGEPVNDLRFKEVLRTTIKDLRPMFQMPQGALADKTLTISHFMRIQVNTVVNEIQKDQHAEKLWMPWDDEEPLPGFTMQPQSCWIWKGLEVVGCTRKALPKKIIVNGFSYTIVGFDSENVKLKVSLEYAQKDPQENAEEEEDEGEEEEVTPDWDEPIMEDGAFEVPHQDFMKHFRLAFAVPVCYAQGRTYRDQKLLIMDTESDHFTMRHLIVAISRVTNGSNLWIAPRGFGGTMTAMAEDIIEARKQGKVWQRPSSSSYSSRMCVRSFAASSTMEVDHPRIQHRNIWDDRDDAADARMMEEDDSD